MEREEIKNKIDDFRKLLHQSTLNSVTKFSDIKTVDVLTDIGLLVFRQAVTLETLDAIEEVLLDKED